MLCELTKQRLSHQIRWHLKLCTPFSDGEAYSSLLVGLAYYWILDVTVHFRVSS